MQTTLGWLSFSHLPSTLPPYPHVVRLVPGFRDLGPHQVPPPRKPKILLFGRTDDATLRNFDCAAEA